MTILLFKRSAINHNSLNQWIERIEEQLMKHGVSSIIIDMTDEKLGEKVGVCLNHQKIDATLTVNAIGQQNWGAEGTNSSIWDVLNIPFINWIVDHPLEHCSDLDSSSLNYNIICIDDNHRKFIERYYPRVRNAFFLPLGGLGDRSIPVEEFEDFEKRKYPIVLSAGLLEPDSVKSQLLTLPEDIREIAIKWTDYMEGHLQLAPEEALREVISLKYAGVPFPDEMFIEIAKICSSAVLYIRTWIRKRIVDVLVRSGLEFHLFGSGWDDLLMKYPNNHVTVHGDVPISEMPEIMRSTKLALNIMPMFKAGTHDRIATAQLNGAAVLTDTNDYIDSLYKDDEIFKYSLNDIEELPSLISSLIQDEKTLFGVALNGQRKAKESMSWDSTGEYLIDIVNKIINHK